MIVKRTRKGCSARKRRSALIVESRNLDGVHGGRLRGVCLWSVADVVRDFCGVPQSTENALQKSALVHEGTWGLGSTGACLEL